ncbi:MAG TPA: cyclopropane-fatty-acyl-phospholipid synthase family protein [Gammaproteobacteria bacterium]|nr:cyclopropane-fatty-acyl-phospholipid synthase family protein [Gammaproteobacteria bacterium]
MLLDLIAKRLRIGTLQLYEADGSLRTIGRGEPVAQVVFNRPGVLRRIMKNPDMQLGESYMDGDWDPGEGGLLALFELLHRNEEPISARLGMAGLWQRARHALDEMNNAVRSRNNVHRHYDIDETLFRGFLDDDMQYSCAYFPRPDITLEEAQTAKREHIARKLLLNPADTVVDIGCGWGGMALHLARHYGARVVGLTLADDQYRVARERAREAGLEGQVEFRLQDYREHEGSYDAVVSVGMFEHVGRPQYQVFFNKVFDLLKDDGRALVHTIGRTAPPTVTNPWIHKYIFPGGYIPALSEVARPVERSGLVLSDLEVLRLHYAETLKAWNQRFQKMRDQAKQRFDERFCRMWEFYLQLSEASFRWSELVNFQLQLARRNDAVPLTRDYLYS